MKKTGPPSVEVTCDALKTHVEDNKFVMAYFGEASDALATAHTDFAKTDEKFRFFHTTDAECAKGFGGAAPGIVLFRKFETQQVAYTGEATAAALKEFSKPLMIPTVFAFDDDKIEFVFDQQQPALFLFRAEGDAESAFQKTFEEAATAHKGKILFSYSGVTDGIQERLAEFIGVTAADLPTLRALLPEGMKKFQSPTAAADLTVENIG